MRTDLKTYTKLLMPLFLGAAVLACAQGGGEATEAEAEAQKAAPGATATGQPGAQAVAEEARTVEATGQVERVDPKGSITIRHGGIEGLAEAGTTEFAVRDLVLLTRVNAGDRVEFTVESSGDQPVVIELTSLGR